ncbi:hypothetical protein AVEN_206276-1 [Araneus ventricosus]|uniref:Histone-lysine N-methyltransferase SETMAR n=1 Tax=Araneus ventricosus TaxID=182803 RepID=A0A4Y2Q672_ARAVE|nr:hypothetical protein AVEN_206276-1 [Araneus ventricosus]
MFKTIGSPADCEFPSVIRFLKARNMPPCQIHVKCMATMRNPVRCTALQLRNTNGVILLQDNAMPPSARVAQESFGCEQMTHPSYSPYLPPNDFHLFLHVKRFLSGQRFHDVEKEKDAVKSSLTSQAVTFYDAGIKPCLSI